MRNLNRLFDSIRILFLAKSITKLIFKALMPSVTVGVFGSFASGLYLPNSDIDLVIEEPSMSPKKLLYKISRILRGENNGLEILELLPHARVPIIKCQDKQTGVFIDMVFNEFSGLLQIEQIKKASENHNEFEYLYLVLKFFLRQRGLNETYSGGIGNPNMKFTVYYHAPK